MTTRLTLPADVVLNLTVWAREHVEHASEDEAWAGVIADAAFLRGREVYVGEIENPERNFDPPRKATVTRYTTAPGSMNINSDSQYVYLDPYVDVEVEGHGAAYTYGRTHQWRKV